MGIKLNVSRKIMCVIVFGIILINAAFGIHRGKVVNAWIDSTREYTNYVFQCANKTVNLTYDEIVSNANNLLNEEKLDEAIAFFEGNMSKRLASGISIANSAYYQHIYNFKEALKLISTGQPQDVSQGMSDVSSCLQKINDTTMSVNEAVEKINSRQSTNNGGRGNSIFEFSIGF